ncbi:hypothetical protein NQ315_003458 [Exocentrus adspersus]|uniref:NACHT domain-containing protein n=1 Tax=Exocentrus adspersus TaxID=1586481 RepID=A0AAV8V7H4_9CUCU|nr:hypothetical protein NQ315_003458 [Exocentrus adspersus]
MAQPVYHYAGKTWLPCRTVADGDCFFHAVFGERDGADGRYSDKRALSRRMYWASFLTYFKEDTPNVLLKIMGNCFVANEFPNNSLDNLQEYANKVTQSHHWVLVEEIPILCTLWHVRVVLFVNEGEPMIFEPNPEMCRDFPFSRDGEVREQVVRLETNHFERLQADVQKEAGDLGRDSLQTVTNDSETDEETAQTESVYLQKKRYKKKGSAGFLGGQYQISLLTMVLLNAVRKMKIWVMSTENDEAGKFEDLVFESPEGDILVQAKHKDDENTIINYNTLMSVSKKGSFSLAKYYVSFQELRRKFKNLRNVVICTNAELQIDKEMSGVLVTNTSDKRSLLRFEDKASFETGGHFYTFKIDDGGNENSKNFISEFKEKIKLFYEENVPNTKASIADEDVKQFLKMLQFHVHYLDKASCTDTFVDNLIASITLADNLDTREIFSAINKYIQNWFTASEGVYLSHLDAQSMFFDIRTNKYCEKLQLYDVSFQNNTLNCFKGRILHIVTGQPILNIVKLHQALQKEDAKALILKKEDGVRILKEGIRVFSMMTGYGFLVVTHPVETDEPTLEWLCKKINTILDSSKDKKLVLVAGEQDKMVQRIKFLNLSSYEEVKKEIGFGDLTEQTQVNMRRQRNIIFQGYRVSLEELLGHKIPDYLDCETLARLAIKGGEIQLGTKLKHSEADADIDTYYIERKVKRSQENLPESQLRNLKDLEDRIILISDASGMGKTTILSKLAVGIKEDNPALWVTKIDMNSHSNTLKQTSKNRSKTVSVDDLLNDQRDTKLDGEFVKKLFHKEDTVVLMLDAVDEVSDIYMKLVMDMISDFKTQKNFKNIFITTRPHLCLDLEDVLQVTAFELEPFTKEDQVNFLAKYWTEKLVIRDEAKRKRCLLFARILIDEMSRWINETSTKTFAGIPLQTKMLAEVFQERTQMHGDETNCWESCKEFLSSDKEEPHLPKMANLSQLYELFLEKKRDIFLTKGQTAGNAITEQMALDKLEECHEYHRALAIQIILYYPKPSYMVERFRKNDSETPSISFKAVSLADSFPESFVENYVFRAGIVQRVGENVDFIHRTFAEYFAAQCLLLELKQSSPSEEFKTFLVEQVLLTEELAVVCIFFDHFLQKELESIPKETLSAFREEKKISMIYDDSPEYLFYFISQGFTGIVNFCLACNDIKI